MTPGTPRITQNGHPQNGRMLNGQLQNGQVPPPLPPRKPPQRPLDQILSGLSFCGSHPAGHAM